MGANRGAPAEGMGGQDQRLAFDPGAFCGSHPRACSGAAEVVSDVGRVVRLGTTAAVVVADILLNPTELSDGPSPGARKILVYRSMRAKGLLPEAGSSARTLGARPGVDVPAGTVAPDVYGMSVSPGSPYNLPDFRRPPAFGGTGKDPVWSLDISKLPSGLTYVPDPANPLKHGFIAPSIGMPFDTYESLLEATAASWELVVK